MQEFFPASLPHKTQPPSLFHLNKAGISFRSQPRRKQSNLLCRGGYIQILFLCPALVAAVYPDTCVPTLELRSFRRLKQCRCLRL